MRKFYKTYRKFTMKDIKYIWETLLMIASVFIFIPSYAKPETNSKIKKETFEEMSEEYHEKQKLDKEIEDEASL